MSHQVSLYKFEFYDEWGNEISDIELDEYENIVRNSKIDKILNVTKND